MKTPTLRRWLMRGLIALITLMLLAMGAAWWALRASLPQLDGPIALPGLKAPLSLGRDALGTVVLQGQHRLDLARGLGYAHAQERFFEMDLTRRSAAGELSALFGDKALERDKERRTHRMRARLTAHWQQSSAEDRALLKAYAEGVNAGLQALPVRPWQYLLLRAEPQPWQAVDSLLVVTEMYWMLQGRSIDVAFERAWVRETVGDALLAWLYPAGGHWDATLDGQQPKTAPLPGPERLDLRGTGPAKTAGPAAALTPVEAEFSVGSNNWAIAGTRSQDGRAILADDMHLGLSAPGIWFRAQFEWQDGTQPRRAAGLTLPGAPVMVVGSTGQIAWGFTNAYGQWQEWIKLPAAVAGRPEPELSRHEEIIQVKGGAPVRFMVEEWQGSPIIPAEQRGGPALPEARFALRWVAHAGEAYNLALDRMLQARTVQEALALGQGAGIPHQNLVVADAQGAIGWTIAGRLWQPRPGAPRAGFVSPADGPRAWLEGSGPTHINPADGLIWTANSRQLGGEGGELIGDGGFDLGARSQQIRERLRAQDKHDLASAGSIHFDTESRLLQSWAERVKQACQRVTCPAEALSTLRGWNGRADADQVGYRLIRTLRLQTLDLLWQAWTRPLLGSVQDDAQQRLRWHSTFEYSASQALDAQAPHLLPSGHASWDALLQSQLTAAAQALAQPKEAPAQPLQAATWGQANMSQVRHVMSRALPLLGRWLDMPALPQSGDAHVPRVAQGSHGQSQRLVVSPGQEERGTLSMPGGQSGHPLSPFYGAGHADWAQGKPTPLLAGPLTHKLQAQP